MAYNQGYYNAFLALGAIAGIVLIASGLVQAGIAVAIFAALSMVLAAIVLITSSPKLARAAALQGGAPLIGTVLVVTSLL
jgi:putative membrane protein